MRRLIPRLALCGVLLALFAAGTATAADVAGEPELATREHVDPLVIPAAAFINDGRAAEGGYDFYPTGDLRGENTLVHFVAQVNLPESVKVHGFSAYLYDNVNESGSCSGLADEVWIRLIRTHLQNHTTDDVASLISSGTSTSVRHVPGTVTSSTATVDNDAYVYYVDVQMCSTAHHLKSVVIDY